MIISGSVQIRGKDGLRGVGVPARGRFGTDRMVLVKLEPEGEILVPALLLEPQEDGSLYLPVRLEDIKRHHAYNYHETHAEQQTDHSLFANGRSASFSASVAPQDVVDRNPGCGAQQEVALGSEEALASSVTREELHAGKVVVKKSVHEHKEFIDEPVFEERAEIERITINRVIEAPVPVRHEGNVTIIPVIEEVLEIRKKLILKEEIRVTRRRTQHHDPQEFTLHGEDAHIEELCHKTTATRSPRAARKRKG